MSRPPSDLEPLLAALRGLVEEHQRLLDLVRRHEAAVRAMDLSGMETLAAQQEASRVRISQLDARRRNAVALIARATRATGEMTLPRIASLYPTHRMGLMKLRDDLKSLALEVQSRTRIAGRIAGALLGHLNTAMRLVAGAVERAGTYTKQGTPHLTRRIGVMEAVG